MDLGSIVCVTDAFNTAVPVAKGEFVFREQLVVNQSVGDPSGTDRDRISQVAVSVLGYGTTGGVVATQSGKHQVKRERWKSVKMRRQIKAELFAAPRR